MPLFQITSLASEKQGARELLEAMSQVPSVQEALRMLEQQTSISQVGNWLQRKILTAFEQERERSQKLQSDLKYEQSNAASFQRIIENINADPLEQKSRRAEAAREVAERELCITQRELAEEREQRERERSFHQSQINDLKQRVAELNRLIANQHKRLDGLIGSGSPE